MSISQGRLNKLIGAHAFDPSGDKIGKIGEIYVDNQTDEPKWVSVKTGLFGTSDSLVPLAGAEVSDDGLNVAPSKSAVKDAPHLDAEGGITSRQEEELFQHYGIDPSSTGKHAGTTGNGNADQSGPTGNAAAGTAAAGTAAGTAAAGGQHARTDQSGTAQASSDDAVIRHEEQLNVDKQREATGKARLRKYVVTENQQVEVPVSREEVVVEREPISADEARNLKGDGGIGEEDRDVTLHEERVTVNKEQVPVEKVRLGTETVTENQTVSDEVRKERIETDVDGRDTKR
ncbi:PRC and DUF2382 domain-containing protein [Rhodococcus sp. NPDC058521]|uniref:PRC and DUF2382 domain-containing protein n=1 Tax=Rhodococcus sp. NPDC058521 TaxID=3346536 RepID=UPI00365C74F3